MHLAGQRLTFERQQIDSRVFEIMRSFRTLEEDCSARSWRLASYLEVFSRLIQAIIHHSDCTCFIQNSFHFQGGNHGFFLPFALRSLHQKPSCLFVLRTSGSSQHDVIPALSFAMGIGMNMSIEYCVGPIYQ